MNSVMKNTAIILRLNTLKLVLSIKQVANRHRRMKIKKPCFALVKSCKRITGNFFHQENSQFYTL